MRVFLINLFSQSSKNITFCEASASFQGSHQMLRLPRLLTLCHVHAALTLRFIEKAFWPRHKSIAPATQNAKMTSQLETLERQSGHFVRDFLQISNAEEILQNTSGSSPAWQRINDATTPRRRPDDAPTTPRRRPDDQNNANTGPTPDPNYKREPFAAHSGRNLTPESHLGSLKLDRMELLPFNRLRYSVLVEPRWCISPALHTRQKLSHRLGRFELPTIPSGMVH